MTFAEPASTRVGGTPWPPYCVDPFHDHAGAAGAIGVLQGTITEHVAGDTPEAWCIVRRPAGTVWTFTPELRHELQNLGRSLAVTVHADAPRRLRGRRFALVAGGVLRPIRAT